jgi:hypothetical protein
MFVHYFTHVPLPLGEVEKRLDRVKDRMTDMADVAYREGERLRAKVGPFEEGFAKQVDMEVGTAEIHRTGIAYPIRWRATGAEILFPRLEAELFLAHVGHATTRIALEGTYDPPLGVLGRTADRVLLGRFADATVRNWLDRLAAFLSEDCDAAVT